MNFEAVCLETIREFFVSKGMTKTLDSFETERKSLGSDFSLPSKKELCISLRIGTLLKKNSQKDIPFKTVLEIVLDFLIHRPKSKTQQPQQQIARPKTGPRLSLPERTTTEQSTPKSPDKKPLKSPQQFQIPLKSPRIARDLTSPRSSASPITPKMAEALNKLIFGKRGIFSMEWHQGFYFCSLADLRFGLIQRKGGPCGVLAPLQAQIILELMLFNASNSQKMTLPELLNPSDELRKKALCNAIVNILWKIGESHKARVVLSPEIPTSYSPYHIIDWTFYEHFTKDSLHSFIQRHLSAFTEQRGNGLILFLYSAILTRGIENVISDMDFGEETTLQAKHGYCSQELVNLLLIGKARTNVFNGNIEVPMNSPRIQQQPKSPKSPRKIASPAAVVVGSTTLHGIENQSDIGYLALFEYYGSCEVGSHFKNPKFPVWIIHSESHYSVLFSPDISVLNNNSQKAELYYYDQLGNSDELYHISIEPQQQNKQSTQTTKIATKDISPIELVIQTRWKSISFDWNGSERLL